MRRSPLDDLGGTDLTQLVHRRWLPRHYPLGNLGHLPDYTLGRDGVVRRSHLDPDDADARVVHPAVMDAVAQVSQPSLEVLAVMLLDERPVGDHIGCAAHRCPVTRVVEEADVDVRIAGNVNRLARLGVCVEQEVDAAAFL